MVAFWTLAVIYAVGAAALATEVVRRPNPNEDGPRIAWIVLGWPFWLTALLLQAMAEDIRRA